MSKGKRRAGIAVYCIALVLIYDLIYSNFFHNPSEPIPGRPNDEYDHGFAPNFSGSRPWGGLRYPFFTNSLGFVDSTVREVPMKSESRRVILIGDSFTEAIGLAFHDTFAGMLSRAGQERTDKIEFLNAGVASYSPAIYYKKIKHIIESGVEFDELVVFSDLSDVTDEAADYFCIDDDPRYRAHCVLPSPQTSEARPKAFSLQSHFYILDQTRQLILRQMRKRILYPAQDWLGTEKRKAVRTHRSAWTIADFDVGDWYQPLGIEGGIARSLQNMQALADLLASRHIPLTIVVYPWPMQLDLNDRESRQVAIWRDFCARSCKEFINLFPAFFAEKDANENWYERLFIHGDIHYSAEGNRLMFRELSVRLLRDPGTPRASPSINATAKARP